MDYHFSHGKTFRQYLETWNAYSGYVRDTSEVWKRERTNFLGAAHWDRLTSNDPKTHKTEAVAFVGYKLSLSKTFIDTKIIETYLS